MFCATEDTLFLTVKSVPFCGLSGSGKTTLSKTIQELLKERNIEAEIPGGDGVVITWESND